MTSMINVSSSFITFKLKCSNGLKWNRILLKSKVWQFSYFSLFFIQPILMFLSFFFFHERNIWTPQDERLFFYLWTVSKGEGSSLSLSLILELFQTHTTDAWVECECMCEWKFEFGVHLLLNLYDYYVYSKNKTWYIYITNLCFVFVYDFI